MKSGWILWLPRAGRLPFSGGNDEAGGIRHLWGSSGEGLSVTAGRGGLLLTRELHWLQFLSAAGKSLLCPRNVCSLAGGFWPPICRRRSEQGGGGLRLRRARPVPKAPGQYGTRWMGLASGRWPPGAKLLLLPMPPNGRGSDNPAPSVRKSQAGAGLRGGQCEPRCGEGNFKNGTAADGCGGRINGQGEQPKQLGPAGRPDRRCEPGRDDALNAGIRTALPLPGPLRPAPHFTSPATA